MKTFKPIIFSAVSILLAAKTFALVPLDISKVQNVEINPSALKTAVCTALKNKIEAKITNYDENRGKHQEMYTKLVDRLTQKIADWKAMGYDVDKLEKDLEILTAKVDTFKSDYVKFIDALKATQNISCGTDTEFKSKLAEAKDALKTLRQDVVEIRQYYWSTVRPDIMLLKQQTPVAEEE